MYTKKKNDRTLSDGKAICEAIEQHLHFRACMQTTRSPSLLGIVQKAPSCGEGRKARRIGLVEGCVSTILIAISIGNLIKFRIRAGAIGWVATFGRHA
jgi:hypothetical protein